MDTEITKRDYGHDEMKDILKSLYSSKENSDLEIVCHGNTFKCHSFLLWSRSKFFAAACKGGFKEAITRRIELPDDNPCLIAKLICYVYSLDYEDTVHEQKSDDAGHVFVSELHTNAELYTLGEKYDLQGLKRLSGAKFDTALKKPSVLSRLRSLMLSLIPLVYNNTPESDRGMRDRVLRFALAHPKRLSGSSEFKATIGENLDFVVEMFSRTVALKPPPPYNAKCTRCKATDKWKVDHVTCSCGWGERC